MTDSFARPDVERALLGCILENSALLEQATDLRPEELSLSSHASIFRHMLAMRDAGEGIDPITVCHRLESHGELDRIGGLEYLGMLVDGVVHSNFSTYVKILHDLARRRNFIGGLAQVTARAEDNSVPTKQLVVDLEKLSAGYRGGVMAERNFRFRTAAELAAGTLEEVKWVARPFVAAGAITSVIGKVKSAGKTTFFTYLVKSVLDGAVHRNHHRQRPRTLSL